MRSLLHDPPMTRQGPKKGEREAFERGLHDVGENLPDDIEGVEGSDVRKVERRKKSENDVIRKELESPTEDVETDLAKDLDL